MIMFNGFVVGFVVCYDNVVQLLVYVFGVLVGFLFVDICECVNVLCFVLIGFVLQFGLKYFSLVDKVVNLIEGWDLFDLNVGGDLFIDLFVVVYVVGYVEGLVVVVVVVQGVVDCDWMMLVELVVMLLSNDCFDCDMVVMQLCQMVLFLVLKLVGEIGVLVELLMLCIDVVIELFVDIIELVLFCVYFDDVVLIEGNLFKIVFVVGDLSIVCGSYVFESVFIIVEDGLEMWLDQLVYVIECVVVLKKV